MEASSIEGSAVSRYLQRADAPKTVSEFNAKAITKASEVDQAKDVQAKDPADMVAWLGKENMLKGDVLTLEGQYWAAQYLAMGAAWASTNGEENPRGALEANYGAHATGGVFDTLSQYREAGYLRVSSDRTVDGMVSLVRDAHVFLGDDPSAVAVVSQRVAGDVEGLTLAQAVVEQVGHVGQTPKVQVLTTIVLDEVNAKAADRRAIQDQRIKDPFGDNPTGSRTMMGIVRMGTNWVKGNFTETAKMKSGGLTALAARAGIKPDNRDALMALASQVAGLSDPTQRTAVAAAVNYGYASAKDQRFQRAIDNAPLSAWVDFGNTIVQAERANLEVTTEGAAAALSAADSDAQLIYVQGDRKFYQLKGKDGFVGRKDLENQVQMAQIQQQGNISVSAIQNFAETREKFLRTNGRANPLGLSATGRKILAGATIATVATGGIAGALPLMGGAIVLGAAASNLILVAFGTLGAQKLIKKYGSENLKKYTTSMDMASMKKMFKGEINKDKNLLEQMGGFVLPMAIGLGLNSLPAVAMVAGAMALPMAGIVVVALGVAVGVLAVMFGIPFVMEHVLPSQDADKLSNKELVVLANKWRGKNGLTTIKNVGQLTTNDIDNITNDLTFAVKQEKAIPDIKAEMQEAVLSRVVGSGDLATRQAYDAVVGGAEIKKKNGKVQSNLGDAVLANVSVAEISQLRVSQTDNFWKERAMKALGDEFKTVRDDSRKPDGAKWVLNRQQRNDYATQYGLEQKDVVRAYATVRFGAPFEAALSEMDRGLKSDYSANLAKGSPLAGESDVEALALKALGRNNLTHAGHVWAMSEIYGLNLQDASAYESWTEAKPSTPEMRSAKARLDATAEGLANKIKVWGVVAGTIQGKVKSFSESPYGYFRINLADGSETQLHVDVDGSGLVIQYTEGKTAVYDTSVSSSKPLISFGKDFNPVEITKGAEVDGAYSITITKGNKKAEFSVEKKKATLVSIDAISKAEVLKEARTYLSWKISAGLPISWNDLETAATAHSGISTTVAAQQTLTADNLLDSFDSLLSGHTVEEVRAARALVSSQFGKTIADSLDVRAFGEDALKSTLAELSIMSPGYVKSVLGQVVSRSRRI
ncbi:MAG: hypothetical protein IPN90_04250 [Elusimicrobia bacterium]|nr:hypothetical protein [Elusimicrobiota bacterium]